MMDNQMWQFQTMFHKSWAAKIKEQTGATHVVLMKDVIKDGEKINCIHIKSKDKEIKYGGKKDFSLFTAEDYKRAILEFNNA